MFDLRGWLRRVPKPRKLRLKVGDDERIVDLGEAKAKKWADIEETVRTSGASAVECLAEDGATIRAMRLSDDESEADTGEDAETRSVEKTLGKERRELAMVLEAQGRAIERAYAAGAKASSASQENLVAIVETLTHHWTLAMTSIHNLSSAYANAIAESGGGGQDGANKPDALMGIMTALLAARNPPAAAPPADPPKKNGAR